MINASANFHVNKPVILEAGANTSTIVVCTREAFNTYNAPFAYIYLDEFYAEAVQAGIEAFNAAFAAAQKKRLDEMVLGEAAE